MKSLKVFETFKNNPTFCVPTHGLLSRAHKRFGNIIALRKNVNLLVVIYISLYILELLHKIKGVSRFLEYSKIDYEKK